MNPRLASLKSHLKSARNLGPVLDEFLELVESPGFLDLGRPVPAPHFDAVLQALTRKPTDPVLVVRLDREGFTHGSFRVGRQIGIVFAFDDLRMGLVAFSAGDSGWTDLYRFTVSSAVVS